jgi:hypothetical protein
MSFIDGLMLGLLLSVAAFIVGEKIGFERGDYIFGPERKAYWDRMKERVREMEKYL